MREIEAPRTDLDLHSQLSVYFTSVLIGWYESRKIRDPSRLRYGHWIGALQIKVNTLLQYS